MDQRLEQKIRERAYELWTEDGCAPGRADFYWLQAEKEIIESVAPVEAAFGAVTSATQQSGMGEGRSKPVSSKGKGGPRVRSSGEPEPAQPAPSPRKRAPRKS